MICFQKNSKYYLFINNNSFLDPFIYFSVLKKNTFNRILLAIYVLIILNLNLIFKKYIKIFPLVKIYSVNKLPVYLNCFLAKEALNSKKYNYKYFVRNGGGIYKNRSIVYKLQAGKIICITKIDKKNSFFLKNENYILDYLKEKKFHKSIPKKKSFSKNNIYTQLTTLYIGNEFREMKTKSFLDFPREIWKISLALNFYKIKFTDRNIYNLNWIKYIHKNFESDLKEFIGLVKEEIFLCFIHGDLISENIFVNHKKKKLIIDFECSTLYGPYLTDFIGFWLAFNYKEVRNNFNKACNSFEVYFSDFDNNQIISALFYLTYITGSEEAKKLYYFYMDLMR